MTEARAPTRFLKLGWLPWFVFAAILVQGATIGLTDDEAYYWVLAQRPALGYAFHPPAVALCIAAAQAALGWLFGHHCVALVRLPAAASAAGLVALGQSWIEKAGGPRRSLSGGLVVIAFAGLFALSWMIVPDFPMFIGWTCAFVATWEICFGERDRQSVFFALGGSITLAILSKYSGVLAGASSGAAIWLWAPRERKVRATMALVAGGLFAAAPILWWNSQHEWGSILYQVRERQGDGRVSWIRYLRFWAIELVLMGPALFYYICGLIGRVSKRQATRAELFVLVWALPGALVFCLQPLWADFKPHWALIVWWPLVLGLALAWAKSEQRGVARIHIGYGLSLIAVVWVACHVPLLAWTGLSQDPKLDVTNDLYGWSDFRQFLIESTGERALAMPVLGSRYQTASQVAFALGENAQVTLLPRDLKARDEWPDLAVSEGQGPDWPKLLKPVLYVADNRYDAPPEYPGATCIQARTFEKRRFGAVAKIIYLWKCVPRSPRP